MMKRFYEIVAILTIGIATPTRLDQFALAGCIFPQGREMVEKIDALYAGKSAEELRKAVLLSAILACLERLVA
jgi:hypothetical protein